jgi:predicted kinase
VTEPGVLLVAGPPCAGKSSVARLLRQGDPRRVLVEVDAVFDLLLPDSDRNSADRLLGYDAAHRLVGLLLERGAHPVLECTYARREQRAALVAALPPGTPVRLVELAVSPAEAVTRFRGRVQATDLDEESLVERVAAYPWTPQALRLEPVAGGPVALAGAVERWLATGPVPLDLEVWARAGRGKEVA